MSRRHVEFDVDSVTTASGHQELRIEVKDLGSTNGILIDGHKVSRAGVRDGSVVRVGNTSMTIRMGEDVDDGLGDLGV